MMRALLRVLTGLLGFCVLGAGGFYAWASLTTNRLLAESVEVHTIDFSIPFPLDPEEVAQAGLSPQQADALALERALERGRHLVQARYACTECHGANFAGGVMVDAPVMAQLFGPNLTAGEGSRTRDYTPADWDRIVRHGVLPDGRPATMPSEDFQLMSDQELSDIVAFIRAQPPVDNQVAAPSFGPLGKVLVALGQIPLSANKIATHDQPHGVEPPAAEPTAEFGRHLAGVCTGCHGLALTGGQILGGDPAWPPAADLTPSGLRDWSYEQFRTAMLEGRRPDGTALRIPMTAVAPYAENMTDVEMEALWSFLRSLPAGRG